MGTDRETERERERGGGGNVNCWLVKVQGKRVCVLLWGVEVYEGRTVDVTAVRLAGVNV